MSAVISLDLQLSVRDGQLEPFRALMHEMVASTRTEPGALIYEWFLSADDTVCHIHERYTDSDVTLQHLTGFGAKFAERFMACVQPTAAFVSGDPSAELREVLDSFGAVYLGWFGGFSR